MLRIEFDMYKPHAFDLGFVAPVDLCNIKEIYARPSLQAAPCSTQSAPPTNVRVRRLIYSKKYFTEYRASMGGVPIVIKIALGNADSAAVKSLEKEARYYQHELKGICGSVIPNFHGFSEGTIPKSAYNRVPSPISSSSDESEQDSDFSDPPSNVASAPNTNTSSKAPAPPSVETGTQDEDDPRGFACILLEDCGLRLRERIWFRVASMGDRCKVLELLAVLHQTGYDCPIKPRNLVQNPETGHFRLIDFYNLSPHKCEFSGDWKFHLTEEPDLEEFGCKILYDRCVDFDFWDVDTTVKIGNHVYSAFCLPDQRTTNLLVESHMLKPWNEPYLIKWLKQVKQAVGATVYDQVIKMETEIVLKIAKSMKPIFPLTQVEFEELYATGYYKKKYGPEIEWSAGL